MALRIRRGTSAQRTGITPVSGELIFDTTQNKLYVGNGSTAGGVEVVAGSIGGNVGSNINLNNFDITGTGNINITGTITASGTITGNGNLVLGNADTDNVQFGADINSNIVPNTGSLTVGTSSKPWQTVFTGALENTAGITSNSNLTLNGLVTVGSNLIPNTTKTKDLGTTSLRWKTVNAETLSLENIQITDNNISTINSNSNINIIPSGTGSVLLSTTKITNFVDIVSTNNPLLGTRITPTSIFYNYNQGTTNSILLNTSTVTSYTQVASATQETFIIGTVDTSTTSGFKITINVSNSLGVETFELVGNVFSNNVSLSGSKQLTVVNSSGVSLISSFDTSAGGGNIINLRLTTTSNVTSGTVTNVKSFITLFRI